MEQHLFPGDVVVSIQPGRMDDCGRSVLCSVVCAVCGAAPDCEKKLVGASVCRNEECALLGRSGTFLGDDLQLFSFISFCRI